MGPVGALDLAAEGADVEPLPPGFCVGDDTGAKVGLDTPGEVGPVGALVLEAEGADVEPLPPGV